MDGGVDAAVQQRFVQFLGEQALAAGVLQAAVGDAVAAGDESFESEIRDVRRSARASMRRHHGAHWVSASGEPREPSFSIMRHSAIGGMEERMLSTLPPVLRPKVVPRS